MSAKARTIIRSRHFYLKGLNDAFAGRLIGVGASMLVGRAPECALVVDQEGISRRHARIEVKSQGCALIDLESANGTFVNGRRIDNALLEDGDEIVFDTVRFQFRALATQAKKRTEPYTGCDQPRGRATGIVWIGGGAASGRGPELLGLGVPTFAGVARACGGAVADYGFGVSALRGRLNLAIGQGMNLR